MDDLTIALSIVGGLSQPSKMPCLAYSIPASACITGRKLRKIPGTICARCYASRGNYLFPHVQAALQRRLESLSNPQWVQYMVTCIQAKTPQYFRWHDSGDLQSLRHLKQICRVAKLTPDCKHLLPTKEYGIVQKYIKQQGAFPANLTVRLSAYMVDGKPPQEFGLPTSVATRIPAYVTCLAPRQGNRCLDCRKCWNKNEPVVYYRIH
jgi:hypothetical protein